MKDPIGEYIQIKPGTKVFNSKVVLEITTYGISVKLIGDLLDITSSIH